TIGGTRRLASTPRLARPALPTQSAPVAGLSAEGAPHPGQPAAAGSRPRLQVGSPAYPAAARHPARSGTAIPAPESAVSLGAPIGTAVGEHVGSAPFGESARTPRVVESARTPATGRRQAVSARGRADRDRHLHGTRR